MHSITVQDFCSLLDSNSISIIDIRDTAAFKENHLEQAISMPATSVPNELANLDKTKPHYVISHSGRRSEVIANYLAMNEIQATHVIGGMKSIKALV
ncbi:MAG: rhodanese-like domain-containing protein [Enterococcus sp.]